ncbi:MAG: Cof-type HAD-IIB family hydrolase [Bacillota bacterium]|nr:Cof-type HAD-IIB family hydrolase [Bacillota bacterium]
MIKAVFVDIDGTLTDLKTNIIPESAKEAVSAARKRGVLVCVASGRHTRAKEESEAIRDMEFDAYVSLNGQICYLPDGKVYHKNRLDDHDVRIVVDFAKSTPFPCVFATLNNLFASFIDDRLINAYGSVGITLPETMPIDEIVKNEIFMICPLIDTELESLILSKLGRCEITRWFPLSADIVAKNGGKHIGLQKTLELFNIDISESIAFGDSSNDITMLKSAGIGVAMGGSAKEVLAAADYIAPPVSEDGLYKTFLKFGII